MLKVNTSTFDFTTLDPMQNEWVYNSLDCCITSEVWEEIHKTVPKETIPTYNFVNGMQAPAMCMALRGIKIDMAKRAQWISKLETRIIKLESQLNTLAKAVWDKDLNANSPQQLLDFFYGTMKIPPEYKYDKTRKERVVTANRDAIEKIEAYFHARPFCFHIKRIRELKKQVGTLKTGIDDDNRMRTSYNVCGTETGRWSSNENAFGTGTNLQNWTDELREIFIADPGYKLAYVDLEQAESRVVAYLSGDENYISACESGDLHTTVSRMMWPGLDWSNEDQAHNAKVAKQIFYRDFSYRDMAKKLGHGTNYRGKPRTMAMHAKVEVKLVEEFQDIYLRKIFKGIDRWHTDLAQELQTKGHLTTPLGRTRFFLGRLWDDDTLKEAIAFVPQSTIGEILNEGMYRVWDRFDGECVRILAQAHDAILFQYKGEESEILPKIVSTLQIPIPVKGRVLVIPAKIEGVGWNWRKRRKDKDGTIINDQGLKEWTGNETRTREEPDTRLLNCLVL